MEKLTRTERGWSAHFCAVSKCAFRRNTLLEYGDKRVVVSTVGNMQGVDKDAEEIGINRYYETMAFAAVFQDPYWEANIGKQLTFKSEWSLGEREYETDIKANDMHEKVVKEFSEKLTKKRAKKPTQPSND